MKSIDLECAKTGHLICAEVSTILDDKAKAENLITKALGVLQEDGVYALLLYLTSLGKDKGGPSAEKKAAMAARARCFEIMKDFCGDLPRDQADPLDAVRTKLACDLGQLLFVKEILERTLVYARYHAKALPEKSKENT